MIDFNMYSESSEHLFQFLCSKSNVTCTKTERDQNAWDFFIEIQPNIEKDTFPDKMPGVKQALVQVKSTTNKRPKTKIKVSNALKLAQRDIPCFLVLFHYRESDTPRCYVIHFWKEMITRALKKARELAIGGHQLNKNYIYITFQEQDKKNSEVLIPWLVEFVRDLPDIYVAQKQELFKTVGYDGMNYTANVSLELPHGYADLVDLQIGLVEELKTNKVQIIDRRFNLDNIQAQHEFGPGSFSLKPSKPLTCTVTMQANNGQTISLAGEFLVPAIPGLPDSYFKIAIHTQILSIVFSKSEIELKCLLEKRVTTNELCELATIMSWGGQNVRLLVRGEEISELDDSIPLRTLGIESRCSVLETVCRGLTKIHEYAKVHDICYSLTDIDKNFSMLQAFYVLSSEAIVRVIGTPLDSNKQISTVDSYSSCVGFLTFSINETHYYVIYEIHLLDFMCEEGTISMKWLNRNVRDVFVDGDEEKTKLKGSTKYRELHNTHLKDCLELGNLNLFFKR